MLLTQAQVTAPSSERSCFSSHCSYAPGTPLYLCDSSFIAFLWSFDTPSIVILQIRGPTTSNGAVGPSRVTVWSSASVIT